MENLYSCLRDLNNGLSLQWMELLFCDVLSIKAIFFESALTSLIKTTLWGIQQLQRTCGSAHPPGACFDSGVWIAIEVMVLFPLSNKQGVPFLNFPNIIFLFEVLDSCTCIVYVYTYMDTHIYMHIYIYRHTHYIYSPVFYIYVPEGRGHSLWMLSTQSWV